MEKTDSHIKRIVMQRVHAVHTLRLAGSITLPLLVLAASLYGIGREVWVARVLENMPSVTQIGSVLTFLEGAFLNTTAMVQVLSILSLGAMLWLARACFRLLTRHEYRIA